MDGKRLIRSIKLTNLLSFGPDGMEIELQPLNVLIGANGSGKSNFVDLFRLLKSIPRDFVQPFLKGGGVHDWIWKGTPKPKNNDPVIDAKIDVAMLYGKNTLRYHFSFTGSDLTPRPFILSENLIEDFDGLPEKKPVELLRYNGSDVILMSRREFYKSDITNTYEMTPQIIDRIGTKFDQSIMFQRSDPDIYPQLFYLSQRLQDIQLYTDIVLGRSSPTRISQDAALDPTFLFEDASNLALVINDLQNQPQVMRAIIEKLTLFYDRVENIITRVQGGTVQIYFQEAGLAQTVPATRLSDGTLRYLCLLVLLLHPSPPPLMCIEEPELGMHPDIIGTIAELLIDASQRTQLIVTTHSDLLISKLSDIPEAVVVCERGPRGTTMRRLDAESLEIWLREYSLGEAWLKGAFGGTRW